MDREAIITRSILHDMSGGVMTVAPDGEIGTFNPAASEILGIPVEEAAGHSLAEVFLAQEEMEEFMQAILDAVYGADVNQQRVVRISKQGSERSLALTTSYLRVADESAGEENLGVIVLFNDITEIRELQQAELRLAESLKLQHAQLQDAYRKIEENNQILASTMQRARIATFSTLGLFLVVGAFAWDTSGPPEAVAPELVATAPQDSATLIVQPQPITTTISLPGQIVPRREVHIASPITGTVASMHFRYGDQVQQGQALLDLDLSEIEKNHRQARATYIKALQKYRQIEDWDNNVEVARVRRQISKAKLALETQKNKVEQTTYLLSEGLIPATEHQAAQQQYQNQLLDFESLDSDLENVLAKGGADEREVAQLELENARVALEALEATLRRGSVTAPVSGVVLQPTATGGQGASSEDARLTRGKPVIKGQRLLTIGNLDQFSVTGKVDEVNVTQIRLGQSVAVTGDAFPQLTMRGVVAHLSSQAEGTQSRSALPSFDVRIDLEELTEAKRQQLRSGMSADLEIVVYDSPEALVVPFSAVRTEEGRSSLMTRDDDGDFRRIEIDVGVTTLEGVEVIRGIKAGDEILLSNA